MALSLLRCWNQVVARNMLINPPNSHLLSTKSYPYMVKVGVPEFLKAVGNGVEAHVEKLDKEIGDFQKLLVTRTLRLKKLGIPCKHDKLTEKTIGGGREERGVYHLSCTAVAASTTQGLGSVGSHL